MLCMYKQYNVMLFHGGFTENGCFFHAVLRRKWITKAVKEQYVQKIVFFHGVLLLKTLKVFCTKIFHVIYKVQFQDNDVLCKSIWENLDHFSPFSGFLVEF